MDSLCLKITRVGLKIPIYIEISCAGSLNGLTNKIKMNVISGTHNLYLISFFGLPLEGQTSETFYPFSFWDSKRQRTNKRQCNKVEENQITPTSAIKCYKAEESKTESREQMSL